MINIISKSYVSSNVNGPQKVAANFVKGLEKLHYPFIVNKDLAACERLWIHDDIQALKMLPSLPERIKVTIGPNLFVLPRHIPQDINLSKAVYVHPSDWTREMWQKTGFDRCPIEIWPTGIDTDMFAPASGEKEHVMIYFKQRYPEELAYVESILKGMKAEVVHMMYWHYTESEYRKALKKTKYIIWIGRQESQGIALEEALAANVPILVWDVDRIGHWQASETEMTTFNEVENDIFATSAFYFDERCGLKTTNREEIVNMISVMEKRWQEFCPRDYILEHLSLEGQATALLKIYEKYWGLRVEDGYKETIGPVANWVNNTFVERSKLKAKGVVKTFLKFIR
ncbi:MAG TPA: hypothetical protein VF810_01750 [Patescibacteria group bacterium]